MDYRPTSFWKFTMASAFVVAMCGTLYARRQESAAPKPGAAEMEKVKFYVGEWDYTETYPKSPMVPNGGVNSGTYDSKLGPGGNSLINSFHSKGPVGDFEGLLIMTWDPKAGSYKQYIFGNNFPGCVEEDGKFVGDALEFRGAFDTGTAKMAMRNSTRVTGPNTLVSEEYVSVNGSPETLLVKVEAKKK